MGTAKRKKSVFSNLIWRFAERCGAQLIQFVVSILLARILLPEDYGIVALVLIFAQVLQVFVDSGLGSALIQKKDADDLDFSTVFYFNVVWCVVLYLVLFVLARPIAVFYGDLALVNIMRVLCLVVVISGIKNVQQAYVSRNMQFKKFFFATLIGTICSGIAGVLMAHLGFGVWALVAQKLINMAIDTLVLWLIVTWRPKRMFSFERLKSLFSYGWKLLVSGLLDTVYNNARQLVIGKVYSQADLAFYNQGQNLPNLIVTNINSSIDSVLLPVMSKEQDDVGHVRNMTRRAIKVSVYVMAPLMMGLAFAGDVIVELLLTEKWLLCVPYLRVFAVAFMFYPIHTANLNAIKALGRSDLFLRLEIIKKVIGLVLLVLSVKHGVMAIALSMLAGSVISQIINAWPNRRLLKYGYLQQLKDVLPGIVLAVGMGILIYGIRYLPIPLVVILIIQIGLGVMIYLLGSKLLKLESYRYILELLKDLFSR